LHHPPPFPIALSPYNLKDYSAPKVGPCVGKIPTDDWIADALGSPKKGEATRYIDLEEYKRARYANALRNGKDAYRSVSYLHLLDGGLADNQGGHTVLETLSSHSPTQLLYNINIGRTRRVVVIAVNARSDPNDTLAKVPNEPGLFDALNSVIDIPIDATTAYSNAGIQPLVDQLNTIHDLQVSTGDKNPLRVYSISVDFDQFHNDQSEMRDFLKNVGTSWNLSDVALQKTLDSGGLLLRQHPCFQHLLQDMKIQADFIDAKFVQSACRLEGD
jgi:NTE family protein